MAFKGTLDTLGTIEVLQVIHMTRKTGCLGVTHPSGEAKHLYFEDGDITAATSTAPKDRLGALLVKLGMLSAEQLEVARRDEQRTGIKQGASLLEQGLLTEEQIDAALTRQISEIFYGLMMWREGTFEFIDDERPPADVFTVRQSVNNLIMQGTRQLDEWGMIEKVFPSLDIVISMSPPRDNSGPISLQPDEWQVLTFVDGRRTIREVCVLSSLSNFDVCKRLLNLHHIGLVVISAAAPTTSRPPAASRVSERFLPAVRNGLTRFVGPIADILLDEVAETLGVTLERLSVDRVPELVNLLCNEIDSPDKRNQFRELVSKASRG